MGDRVFSPPLAPYDPPAIADTGGGAPEAMAQNPTGSDLCLFVAKYHLDPSHQ